MSFEGSFHVFCICQFSLNQTKLLDVAFPILEHSTLQCLAFILGSYTCSRCYLLKSSCHKCDLCFNIMCNVQGMHTILVWKVVITKSKMTKYPKDVKLSLSSFVDHIKNIMFDGQAKKTCFIHWCIFHLHDFQDFFKWWQCPNVNIRLLSHDTKSCSFNA